MIKIIHADFTVPFIQEMCAELEVAGSGLLEKNSASRRETRVV